MFFILFHCPEIAISVTIHVPFSLSQFMVSDLLLAMALFLFLKD